MSARWHIRSQGIPLHSIPTAKVGSWCAVGEPVAAIDYLPGNLSRIEIARDLGVAPQQLNDCVVRDLGTMVERGEIIGLSLTFGYPLAVRSPYSGTLAQISRSLGAIYLRQRGVSLKDEVTIDLLGAYRTSIAKVAEIVTLGGSNGIGNMSDGVSVNVTIHRICVQVGELVERGQTLAILSVPKPGEALLGQRPVNSPCRGVIEAIDQAGAKIVMAPRETTSVASAYSGYVIGVSSGQVEFALWGERIVGAYGIGSVATGPLIYDADPRPGCIWVIPRQARLADLERARAASVGGVWMASVEHRELEAFAGGERVRSVTGAWDGPVIVISEGFGDLDMPVSTCERLSSLTGRVVSISGQTHLRAGAVRPELLLTGEAPELAGGTDEANRAWWADNLDRIREAAREVPPQQASWVAGMGVRGMWGHRQGWQGELIGAPEPATLASGVRTDVALVRWENGLTETVPVRNLIAAGEEVGGDGRQG